MSNLHYFGGHSGNLESPTSGESNQLFLTMIVAQTDALNVKERSRKHWMGGGHEKPTQLFIEFEIMV